MYTQELACPHCGEIVRVNVLTSDEAKTPQSNLCYECGQTIYYDVDALGEIKDIRAEEVSGGGKGFGAGGGGGNREPRW